MKKTHLFALSLIYLTLFCTPIPVPYQQNILSELPTTVSTKTDKGIMNLSEKDETNIKVIQNAEVSSQFIGFLIAAGVKIVAAVKTVTTFLKPAVTVISGISSLGSALGILKTNLPQASIALDILGKPLAQTNTVLQEMATYITDMRTQMIQQHDKILEGIAQT